MGFQTHFLILLLTLLSAVSSTKSWTWFTSSSSEKSHSREQNTLSGSVSHFSIEAFDDPKGIRLVENAKKNSISLGTCWQNAYSHLFSGCSESLSVDEKRSRFAWHLSECFQNDSGRQLFPPCHAKSAMSTCLKALNEHEHKVYLEFYLETNSICHQLQAHAFRHETERLVNELKSSARYAEEKLDTIESKTEHLMHSSDKIHDSLNSIDARTQQVEETAKSVGDRINVVMSQSEAVYEASKKLASSQAELRDGQAQMKRNLDEGIATLQESYSYLGDEIGNLRNEAAEIEREISRVGDSMSSKMTLLHSKADDIGNLAGISLDKQQQLLDGQTTAIKDLQFLTRFQSEALEESRSTLQRLAEYGHKQQEELLLRQKQLQQVHDHLMDNSKSILEAQESFESKQATMFLALEKLFALHTALVLESRLIKAFFIYSVLIFVIYMFTSTKQTYKVRPLLYIGLCATFCVEVAILRFTIIVVEQQTRIVNVVRLLFAILASVQLIHAVCTYRDYEMLNYHMLQTLIEKVNRMQSQDSSCDSDCEINWSSWIDADLPEDVNKSVDPDYVAQEEIVENSITTSTSSTKRYNLRRRVGS